MMIVLDTSACIDFLKGDQSIRDVLFRHPAIITITAITEYEIYIGFESTKRKYAHKYTELLKNWLHFTSTMEILPLGSKEAIKAAEVYDKLESTGKRIDDNDILIVGIMLSNGIKQIITKNVKHFNRIEEIEVIKY